MLNQYCKAIEMFKKALAIALEVGDRVAASMANTNLVDVYEASGQIDKAAEMRQAASYSRLR